MWQVAGDLVLAGLIIASGILFVVVNVNYKGDD